ncbi:MAG: tagaturonate epimerase family protein, partial [Armatimonadota bacterium]|nr:tagaturonate epimerase family protein [Armatimonadota bacterium]
LDEEALFRAAVKYGRALAHTAAMYRHLKATAGDRPFELEMSVDETATPTSVAEHVFVARELRRLGVEWVSLAPRFIGEFEKGVDYIGDLAAFEKSFAGHVAVAQHFGPYKISIHSGSDKFSIYPIAARLAGDLVHLKTAGTSYLEALRAIATIDPSLFREIMGFAIDRYPEDRASYHVSADLAKVPAPQDLADADLPAILDQFDTRETLHVTFGSVLTAETGGSLRFKDRFMQVLDQHEDVHYDIVRRHIVRHLTPFVQARP